MTAQDAPRDELEAWVHWTLRRCLSALAWTHGAQVRFLFENLYIDDDPVRIWRVFLNRVDALERDPKRFATRSADRGAVAILAERGLGRDVRDHLRRLVERAELDAFFEEETKPEDVLDVLREIHGRSDFSTIVERR